ncbi:MAG: DinB family protein [Gemmatimonadales bacterium]
MIVVQASDFVDYWRGVRRRTRRLLPLVPAGRLEWQPGPGRWSFGDLFRHLAAIERWMYAENVAGRPSRYPGHDAALAGTAAEVGEYLDRMHLEACAIFAGLSSEQLAAKSVTPAGTPITTSKWLRAMVEHEAHHRGQIHLMLGLLGVAAPQIFGLTEEEVRARSAPGSPPSSTTA